MGLGTVLVIHSDSAVLESARRVLEGAAYDVHTSDGSDVHLMADPDLVLLEWHGLDRTVALLGSGREDAPTMEKVIVMASAREFSESVSALALGAADCVRVPFEEAELLARVSAALSRPSARVLHETLEAGPVVLDKTAHRVAIHGQPLALAPTEFRLLAFFLEHPDRVFARIELLQRAWTKELKPSQQRTVDVHVRRLRQVLEPFACDEMIQTVRGFGYRFSPRSVRRPGSAEGSSDERQGDVRLFVVRSHDS